MFQFVYVPERYRAWCLEFGDMMQNQQTKETYLVLEETLEEWAAGGSVFD